MKFMQLIHTMPKTAVIIYSVDRPAGDAACAAGERDLNVRFSFPQEAKGAGGVENSPTVENR